MSGFLYFFPGAETWGQVAPTLAGRNLKITLGSEGVADTVKTQGPNGESGLLCRIPSSRVRLRINSAQYWRQIGEGDSSWMIGWDEKPQPDDLVKANTHGILDVELWGERWLIPSSQALPQELGLNFGTGLWESIVPEEYRPLADLSDKAEKTMTEMSEITDGEDPSKYIADMFNIVVELLNWNYKTGIIEMGMIGNLTTEKIMEVIATFLDLSQDDGYVSKKKD